MTKMLRVQFLPDAATSATASLLQGFSGADAHAAQGGCQAKNNSGKQGDGNVKSSTFVSI